MRNLVQHILDSIAVWGPSALVLPGAVSLWGLARVYPGWEATVRELL